MSSRTAATTAWAGNELFNIGKNIDTPVERAADDYLACLRKVYELASYVTVNISSPNTKGLRSLQEAAQLAALLAALSAERNALAATHGKRVPLALKVAPDLDEPAIQDIADAVRRHRFDAVIATNTTVSRECVEGLRHATEAGGLSGAPLAGKSTDVLRKFVTALQGETVIPPPAADAARPRGR